jgi:hypothetical protein
MHRPPLRKSTIILVRRLSNHNTRLLWANAALAALIQQELGCSAKLNNAMSP